MSINNEALALVHKLNEYNNNYSIEDLCKVAKVDYLKINLLEKRMLEAKKIYLLSLKNKDTLAEQKLNIQDYEDRKNHYYSTLFHDLMIRPNVVYSPLMLLTLMTSKSGVFDVVKTLYSKELQQVFSTIRKKPSMLSALETELNNFGLSTKHFLHLVNALNTFDVQRYNEIVKAISIGFCSNYRGGLHDMDFKECMDDAILVKYGFSGVHSTLEIDKIAYIPEIMLFKIAFSKVLVNAYGE